LAAQHAWAFWQAVQALLEKANGKVYLLWQNDPYNNNRTKWYRNDF
jgi:hypothetical protein